jgi:hypothetical protein
MAPRVAKRLYPLLLPGLIQTMMEPEDKERFVDDMDRKQRDLDGIAGIERKLLEKNLAGIGTEDQFDNLMAEYRGIRLRSEAPARQEREKLAGELRALNDRLIVEAARRQRDLYGLRASEPKRS